MTMAADNDGAVVVTGACPPISRRSDRAGQSIYSVGFCRLPGWSCLVQRSTTHSVSSKGRRSRDLIRVVLSCQRDKTPHTNSLLVKYHRPLHSFSYVHVSTFFYNIFVFVKEWAVVYWFKISILREYDHLANISNILMILISVVLVL